LRGIPQERALAAGFDALKLAKADTDIAVSFSLRARKTGSRFSSGVEYINSYSVGGDDE